MPIPGGTPDVHRFAKGNTAQMMQKQKMIKSYQMAEREAAAESGDAHMLVATLLDELLRRMNRYAESVETEIVRQKRAFRKIADHSSFTAGLSGL